MSETSGKGPARGLGLSGRLASDRNLANRISGGDSAALTELFRRYHQPIYRFCAAMVGPEEAKDALQNVMTKAMTSMPDNEDFEMKAWLYRVARNECLDQLRSGRRGETGLAADRQADVSGLGDPHRTAVSRERLDRLVEDIGDLPEKQRATLVMRELSGLPYSEIAAALNTTETAAKQLVYEARLSLQQADVGRNLDCAEIRESISGNDRRRLRSRKVRAHLKSCRGCEHFEKAITARRTGFQSLAPALPAGIAAGLLGGIRDGASFLSGPGTAASAAGGIAAGGAATGLVTKGVVALVVAGGLGVGTAEVVKQPQRDSGAGSGAVVQRESGRESGPDDGYAPRHAGGDNGAAISRKIAPEAGFSSRPGGGKHGRDRARNGRDSRSKPPPGNVAKKTGTNESLTPGQGVGLGPAKLPEASAGGQGRAHDASGSRPGQTGNPPPSQKPSTPPGRSVFAETNAVSGAPARNPGGNGKSAAIPTGNPASRGKSGK